MRSLGFCPLPLPLFFRFTGSQPLCRLLLYHAPITDVLRPKQFTPLRLCISLSFYACPSAYLCLCDLPLSLCISTSVSISPHCCLLICCVRFSSAVSLTHLFLFPLCVSSVCLVQTDSYLFHVFRSPVVLYHRFRSIYHLSFPLDTYVVS